MAFLEDPVFPDDISYGSKGGPMFNTAVAVVNSGHETRNANWLYPRHKWNIAYGIKTSEQMWSAREYFYVVRGQADGFRFKDWHDYTSGINNASATAFDTVVTASAIASTSTYQLLKQYTKGNSTFTRKITKPIGNTVVVAVGSAAYLSSLVSVIASSGTITFDADISVTVSGITQSVSAHVSATGHGYAVNNTIAFNNVGGMTEINGERYTIVSTTANGFEINADTSTYSVWTTGGDMHTHPQDGEVIQAGYQFDVPVRFNSDMFDVVHDDYDITSMNIEVIELR